jgi:hypothetical protein
MNYIGYIKKLLRQPIGAIPVGLSVNIAGVKLGFERQFEIDGKIRLDVVSDRKKVVSIDGVLKNKPKQVKKLTDFVLKTTSRKTTSRKTTEKKINPDKGGFLFRKTTDGYKQEPKTSWSLYKNSKLPNRKLFIGKNEFGGWMIIDLLSGYSVGQGNSRKGVIESFERILESNSKKFIIDKLDAHRLPKKEMDVVMIPYDYVKKQSSKKSTPKKSTSKKSYVIESKGWNYVKDNIKKKKKELEKLKKELNKTKKSPPKKSKKRVVTKKGKAGNLVYVGREKVGKKMLYQYEYKNITKKK